MQLSLIHVCSLPDHSVTKHLARSATAFTRHPSAWQIPTPRGDRTWLRHSSAGSPLTHGRIVFVSYGLTVHLLMLPTPPHGDAVPVGYRPEDAYLKGTHTPLTTHTLRRTEAAGRRRSLALSLRPRSGRYDQKLRRKII